VALTNQRIVIIGGSSGMGLATARAAAAAGAAVTIASSDQGRLDTALAGLPGNCDGAVLDTRIRPGGSIVLTSGTIGVRPAPGAALAAAGAGAIEGLTRGLAVELAPIRVNSVRPGAIRTPMWDPIPEPQREALFANLAERTLTKTIGEPDQIAATHLYLMENRLVTGTVLTVDGGSILTGAG
jgi:NAD(P)-dependent dehydrogenase (short-subunit alcohol dehydrogenase family)